MRFKIWDLLFVVCCFGGLVFDYLETWKPVYFEDLLFVVWGFGVWLLGNLETHKLENLVTRKL
jgi:hypothetical protein